MRWFDDISLTCKEATLLIVKKQGKGITWKERLQMHLHLLLCAVCRLFYKQTTLLDKHFHEVCRHDDLLPYVKMDEHKKQELIRKLTEVSGS